MLVGWMTRLGGRERGRERGGGRERGRERGGGRGRRSGREWEMEGAK